MITLSARERRDPSGESSEIFCRLFRRKKERSFVEDWRDDVTDAFTSQYEGSQLNLTLILLRTVPRKQVICQRGQVSTNIGS